MTIKSIEEMETPSHQKAKRRVSIPEQLLQEFSSDHKGIWKEADLARQTGVRNGHVWPDYVFMPELMLCMALLRVTPELINAPFAETSSHELVKANFLGAWRNTKGIYRYSPQLYEALTNTPLDGDIPCEALKRLPEWAVYIETPNMKDGFGESIDGFGACVDCDHTGECRISLSFMRRTNDETLTTFHTSFSLDNSMSMRANLKQGAEAWRQGCVSLGMPVLEGEEVFHEQQMKLYSKSLSLLLWLCSEEPDIADWNTERPRGTRTKTGTRFFQADRERKWDVGLRIGAELGMAATAPREGGAGKGGTHASPRGHIRRAHWHTYRTGEGRTIPKVKWIPPTPINLGREILPTTVRPVVGDVVQAANDACGEKKTGVK